MNSSVGGCGGGEVEGVRTNTIFSRCSYGENLLGLPAVGAACFLGCTTARVLALSSESEFGSSVRCRLGGLGRAGWWVVVVPLFSQGRVLAMIMNAL